MKQHTTKMKIYFFLLAFALLESGCLAMPQVDDVIPEDYDVFPEDTLLSITDMDPTEFSSPIMGPEAVPEIVRKGEVADGATGGNWIVGLGALRAARQTTKKAVRDSKAEAQFKESHVRYLRMGAELPRQYAKEHPRPKPPASAPKVEAAAPKVQLAAETARLSPAAKPKPAAKPREAAAPTSFLSANETEEASTCQDMRGKAIDYLDREAHSCSGTHTVMTQWKVGQEDCTNDALKITAMCRKAFSFGAVSVHHTECHIARGKWLQHLEHHNVACANDKALTSFRFESCDGNRFRYKYECATIGATKSIPMATHPTPMRNKAVEVLDGEELKCPDGSALRQFQLQPTGGDNFHYEFTCVSTASAIALLVQPIVAETAHQLGVLVKE